MRTYLSGNFLINSTNAVFLCFQGRLDGNRLAFHKNGASIHMFHARQHFDQGGLTCSVFSQQCMDLSCLQGELYILERNNTGKLLIDMLHHKQGILIQVCILLNKEAPGTGRNTGSDRGPKFIYALRKVAFR